MSFSVIFPRISCELKNPSSFLSLERRVYISVAGVVAQPREGTVECADNNCKLTNCGGKEGRKRDRVGYGEGGEACQRQTARD